MMTQCVRGTIEYELKLFPQNFILPFYFLGGRGIGEGGGEMKEGKRGDRGGEEGKRGGG